MRGLSSAEPKVKELQDFCRREPFGLYPDHAVCPGILACLFPKRLPSGVEPTPRISPGLDPSNCLSDVLVASRSTTLLSQDRRFPDGKVLKNEDVVF